MTELGVNMEALKALSAPTPKEEIKQRAALKRDGSAVRNPDGTPKFLDYVDARFVQDRLDEAIGSPFWQTKFEDTPGGIRCGIGILMDEIGWVWKWDVGIPSNIEPVKGAHSDAFKRAAVHWGVARDLYSNKEDVVETEETVAEKAAGSSRAERYEDTSSGGYVVGPEEPSFGIPSCPTHGPMVRKTGRSAKGPWAGWFCPSGKDSGCPTQPIWENTR